MNDMESTSENLNNISEDLKQLTGKTIELTREKKRLTNHRDVSLLGFFMFVLLRSLKIFTIICPKIELGVDF